MPDNAPHVLASVLAQTDTGVIVTWIVLGVLYLITILAAIDASRQPESSWARLYGPQHARRKQREIVRTPLTFFLLCGAGAVWAIAYFVSIKPRLERVAAGGEARRSVAARAGERMLMGDVTDALGRLEDDLIDKLELGRREFGLHISEANVGMGLLDGWQALIPHGIAVIEANGCEVLDVSETGPPGSRRITFRVLNPIGH